MQVFIGLIESIKCMYLSSLLYFLKGRDTVLDTSQKSASQRCKLDILVYTTTHTNTDTHIKLRLDKYIVDRGLISWLNYLHDTAL